jgi:hypothetical protein
MLWLCFNYFFNDTFWLLFWLSEETGELEEGIRPLQSIFSREEEFELVHSIKRYWLRLWFRLYSLGDFFF